MEKPLRFHEIFESGTLARQWRINETQWFCHRFSWKICAFQYNLVGGTLGKLLENHGKTIAFS